MSEILSQLPTKIQYSFEPKFYIKDTNDTWVDFSDRSTNNGVDKLGSVGTVSNKIEKGLGTLVSTASNVILTNKDGFFNKPFPDTLKNIVGTTAVFELSIGYKKSILKGRQCRIDVIIRTPNMIATPSANVAGALESFQQITLGHFFIDDVLPNLSKREISLKIISLDAVLKKKEAVDVKNGFDWYKSRPVSFLIEEILKTEFATAGALPNTYNITRLAGIVPLDGLPVVSNLGRPPIWDGTNWKDLGLYARSILHANVESSGAKLYLGCDEQLWSYDTSTNEYTLEDGATIPAGYYIKKMWYDSGEDAIFLAAWKDEFWGTLTEARQREGWSVKLYSWTPTLSTLKIQATDEMISFSTSMMHSRATAVSGSNAYIVWGIVGTENDRGGKNIYVPFQQHVKSTEGLPSSGGLVHNKIYVKSSGGNWGNDLASETSNEVFNTSDGDFGYATKGFIGAQIKTDSTAGIQGRIASMINIGSQPCVVMSHVIANNNNKKHLYYFDFRMTGGSPDTNAFIDATAAYNNTWVGLMTSVISETGAGAIIIHAAPAANNRMLPICMAVNKGDDTIYCFMKEMFDTVNSTPKFWMQKFINLNDTSLDPWSTKTESFSTETGDNLYWAIIGLEFYGTNDGVSSTADKYIACYLNAKLGQYVLVHGQVSNVTTTTMFTGSGVTKLRYSTQPYTGFVYDEVDDSMHVYAVGEGKIYTVDKDGTLTVRTEFPAVSNEFGLLAGLAVNQAHPANAPEIFGVSSPTTHLDSFYTYPAGKFNLFRYFPEITDLVEYASFKGQNKWQAISQLSQSTDSLSFFNAQGDFNYLNRVYASAGAADYVLGGFNHSGYILDSNTTKASISLGYGYDKVVNIVKAKIYNTVINPPSDGVLTLVPRTDKNSGDKDFVAVPFVDFAIEQRDTVAKSVLAFCITGGKTDDGASRWKYTTSYSKVEVIIKTLVSTSATTINLNSVFGGDATGVGIHSGDFISYNNPSDNSLLIRGIVSVNESANQITLDSTFGIELKPNIVMIVTKGFKTGTTWNKSNWSDEGVSYVTDSGGLSIAGTTFTPENYTNLSVNTVIRFGEQVEEYRINKIEKSTGVVTFSNIVGGAGLVTAVTQNTIVYAFFSATGADGDEIGGTSIIVKWFGGSGIEETDYTKSFISGDRISIDSSGQELKPDAGSTQVIVNAASQNRHGKTELLVDNRFMTRQIGKEIAERMIFYNAEPRFQLKVKMPMIPYIDVVTNGTLTTIDFQNPELFPVSQNFTERFLVQSIRHDLSKMLTELELIAINAY